MKTIQYWLLTFGLLSLSACSMITILFMKFASMLAIGFFMDSLSLWIDKQIRALMVNTLYAFDYAQKIVDTESAKNKLSFDRIVDQEIEVWRRREKNKKYRVMFKTPGNVTLWACIIVEHCASCAITAALKENNKMKFVEFNAGTVLAEAEFLEDVK